MKTVCREIVPFALLVPTQPQEKLVEGRRRAGNDPIQVCREGGQVGQLARCERIGHVWVVGTWLCTHLYSEKLT